MVRIWRPATVFGQHCSLIPNIMDVNHLPSHSEHIQSLLHHDITYSKHILTNVSTRIIFGPDNPWLRCCPCITPYPDRTWWYGIQCHKRLGICGWLATYYSDLMHMGAVITRSNITRYYIQLAMTVAAHKSNVDLKKTSHNSPTECILWVFWRKLSVL